MLKAELCACVFAFDRLGRVLLVRSVDRRDTWELPGGQCEPREEPADAAVREAMEETAPLVRLAGCSGDHFNTSHRRLVLTFLGEAEGDPAPSAETPEVAWFGVEAASGAISRPSLRLRWMGALALRGSRPAGYAAYSTAPWAVDRRLP